VAAALALGVMLTPKDAYAHGGSFRGPNGGVPPGMREPSDPEPPPPPPSDPGQPGGPTTPGEPAPPGPTTPSDPGYSTPGDSNPPAPVGPTAGGKKKATSKAITFESWRFWWAYNNDDILNLKESIYSARTSSSSPIFFASKRDEENRRNAQRPTLAAVQNTIIPALERRVEDPSDKDDVQGGAVVALGKVGTVKYVPFFRDAMRNGYKNSKGTKIEYQNQTTESAALALGLLPEVDAEGMKAIREVCLAAVADDKMRTRERAWSAVSLGFQKDVESIPGLFKLLWSKKHPDENVPAGILCGLGLMGEQAIHARIQDEAGQETTLAKWLIRAFDPKTEKIGELELSDRVRSFVGYALMKLEAVEALIDEKGENGVVLDVLGSRRAGQIHKRSAAIAAGVLGAKANEQGRDKAVKSLQSYIRKSNGDSSGENFSIISLSQIGTLDALKTCLELAADGQNDQKAFAALGLATHFFYKERAAGRDGETGIDPKFRNEVVEKIRALSDKFKDADTQAAFFLARGILKDKTVIEPLTMIVADTGKDATLRGFCCVALGLVGDTSEKVKESLKLALKDKKSNDLRRDAATGLGLLRDAEVVKILLDELKNAKSFAVQAQIIQAVGTIGDHTAIEPLVEILDNKNENEGTRAMAAVGLGMIGDLQEIGRLARLSKNYNYRASVKDIDELLFIL
jgi:HEAT repeat protein